MNAHKFATKADLDAGIASVRTELAAESGKLRDEIGALREETRGLGTRIFVELTNMLQDVKTEIRSEIRGLRSELHAVKDDILQRLDAGVSEEAQRAIIVEDSLGLASNRHRKWIEDHENRVRRLEEAGHHAA